MEDFDDEPGSQEPGYLFSDSISSLIIETMKELLHWFQFGVCLKAVLSEFPRDTWHVRRFPCKDVSILTDELDERAFLFVRQACLDGELLRRVTRDKVDFLSVLSRLKLWIGIRSRLFQDRGICRVHFLLVC